MAPLCWLCVICTVSSANSWRTYPFFLLVLPLGGSVAHPYVPDFAQLSSTQLSYTHICLVQQIRCE
jgi:hypothetical protein